jgi:hypothetical protein
MVAFYNGAIPIHMKNNRFQKTLLVFALLICLLVPSLSASAAEGGLLPVFSGFVVAVSNGQAKVVRGVYVPGTLALRVMQQPADDPKLVFRVDGVATQFGMAASNHVIGLLAHNNLAGASFSGLKIGQEVRIVYGDGRVDYYTVDHLARFQVLQPGGQAEDYLDLNSKLNYTARDIFTTFYAGADHVTFQTCIFKDGNSSWGRLFITAIPVPSNYLGRLLAAMLQTSFYYKKVGNVFGTMVLDFGFR